VGFIHNAMYGRELEYSNLYQLERTKVVNFLSANYQYEHRPVIVLRDFQIYQNGAAVGFLKTGVHDLRE
jgi:hypothetical protein